MTNFRCMALVTIVVGCLSLGIAGQAPTLRPMASVVVRDHLGGGGRAFDLDSNILGETRRVQIAIPDSHGRTTRSYPVLVVLDGESLFAPAVAMVSALSSAGHVPEMIVVGIPNTRRLRDLTPPGLSVSGSSLTEGGDRFLNFIERELLPTVNRELRGGGLVVLVGHSSGGILATYAAATRSTFGMVLALDTPAHLGDGWLGAQLKAHATTSPTSRLRYTSLSARFGWPEAQWNDVATVAPDTWRLSRQHLDQESHESMVVPGLYLGIRDLFADYAAVAAPAAPTMSTLTHYQHLTGTYGVRLVPPRGLLRRLFEDLLLEHRAAPAREVLDWLVEGYGAPQDLAALNEQLAAVAAAPPPTETIEGLLATPPPTAEAGRPFVGRWEGASWTRPEAKSFLALDVKIESGRLVADVISRPMAGAELVERATYLKVVEDGLEFGYLNGMRPRGVLVHSATLDGDVLKGQMRLGGMTFTMPNGRSLPPVFFELRRVLRPLT